MTTPSLSDLRRAYFGGGSDAEYAQLQSMQAAGINASQVLGVVQQQKVEKWPTGRLVQTEGGTGTGIMVDQFGHYMPLWVPEAKNCDRIYAETTVAGAGGAPVLRAALYAPDANGDPGARIVDAGTQVATGVGLVTWVVNAALPAGWIWGLLVPQGATVTQPTLRSVDGFHKMIKVSAVGASQYRSCYTQTPIAGAAPANAAPDFTNNARGRWMGLRAA